ncbi:hypothetical protein CCR94_16585 [Rhodoblastus sphagnicola]|uniref:Uncharacterized protein n=1 Tax=Rhodoblastus sphagnicola TaxID=333368 RepID=A0A2S6N303_9HYPH|nr:hypothetical protein CCR94_16585 [Rhodoblastus sphagnicola]
MIPIPPKNRPAVRSHFTGRGGFRRVLVQKARRSPRLRSNIARRFSAQAPVQHGAAIICRAKSRPQGA